MVWQETLPRFRGSVPARSEVGGRWQSSAEFLDYFAVGSQKEEIRYETGCNFPDRGSCSNWIAVCGCSKSTRGEGGSELCAADGIALQRLSLYSSGTQPGRPQVQVDRLCGSRGRDEGHKD